MRLLAILCLAAADSGHALVDFPMSDSPQSATHPPDLPAPAPHLPFRRISLPSAPNLIQRQSIVSTVSIDSIPEGPRSAPLTRGASRGPRHRPSSVEAARRNRRREVKSVVLDEQREAKRRKVVHELYETERTYVDGLELIYSHFLTPIIASLDTPNQLLDRVELTSVFSNFIDIWNLHRSFYTSLSTLLNTSTSTLTNSEAPPVSPILLSHFPYLSLYTPFISSFADALTSYSALLAKHPNFASFIAAQEASPRCGKLKFRDWLLTIVQRCPRYLLLLKDLIHNTSSDDPEYNPLVAAHTLVSKITDSLNASLHTHAQTLSLLAIQRSTSGLPFQLISPGRTLLKRAPLFQVAGSTLKEREFFLFSDCLVWLSNADKIEDPERLSKFELLRDMSLHPDSPSSRPHSLVRTRSKSDADLPKLTAAKKRDSGSKLASLLSGGLPKKKRMASSGAEERWVYKGHIDLVDLEVILGPPTEQTEQLRFEVLSPRRSFAVYAFSSEERDEWTTSIRNAKASLLVSLNAMHPNSTLTSSDSTNHLRHALQALPYLPDEKESNPTRGKVEHFVPAIWIPDSKTESCMRCGRTFGWRRRRHHCRLCGRCVCSTCSTKTFFILDSGEPASKHSHRSARACDACYDTVFPILDPMPPAPETSATMSHLTLSGLRSMPSLLLDENLYIPPSVLMAIDVTNPRGQRRPHSALAVDLPPLPLVTSKEPPEGGIPAVRIRAPSRPRSYIQILEDFNDQSEAGSSVAASPATSRFARGEEASFALDDLDEGEEDAGPLEDSASAISPSDAPSLALPPSPAPRRASRKEDTVRRRKRFSLPAVALHTTPVTARPNVVGEGRSKRWSLVLGNLRSGVNAAEFTHGMAAGKLNELLGRSNRPAV